MLSTDMPSKFTYLGLGILSTLFKALCLLSLTSSPHFYFTPYQAH